jgi:maltose/moltooligosaccharide transporter
MIVVPMLIQTVTFGWIFENVLGGDGTNAIVFAGVLFGIGAVAMLFVSPPRETEESEIMPLGAPRRIDNVYNRVVVGSDGTPASLVTVGHAAGVAAAADADLFVVSAYNPQATPEQPSPTAAAGEHQDLYGEEAAREAIRISIKELKKERARSIDHQIVEGSPAHALLEVAGSDPRNLIVVGNRGLGAEAGEALGSVPREVVKNAVCNVMVVQTGAEGNQRSEGIVHTPGRGG